MKGDLIFELRTNSKGTHWRSRVGPRISNHNYNKRSDAVRGMINYINKILESKFEFTGFTTREKLKILRLIRRP